MFSMLTEGRMTVRSGVGLAALIAACASYPLYALQGQRSAPNAPQANGYITGAVQGSGGPEAGVWVIAETKGLPTNFIKIVVTDDQGRFMLPDLPAASYSVWVRGYGLADSTPIQLRPGAAPVTLKATTAKTPQAAAKVYPGNYWLSLMEPPAKSLFPGTGPQGNGLGLTMQSQNNWIYQLKSGCNFCHQLGNLETRNLDHVLAAKP